MSSAAAVIPEQRTIFGHPTGLFMLFFAEMWERFSFYGMKALLVFYMIKGFLQFKDNEAYSVYGAYTALVYAAPFLGGMLADRLLGQRRAVIIGGLLMAAGHLLMTVEHSMAFFCALSLLICGNGFFKPNISTMVGQLYPQGSPRRDAGFTIFYMGINLGAAIAPIVCGYVGEVYGWHWGFGLATGGMLIGVAIFAAPTKVTQFIILTSAAYTAVRMPFLQDSLLQLLVRLFLAAALSAAAVIALSALQKGGVPTHIGQPPDMARLKHKIGGLLRADWAVYLGIACSVPLVALLVRGDVLAGWVLFITGGFAFAYVIYDAFFRCNLIERHRVFVVLIMMFFSLLFWTFFEQAGSSLNNFADRNIDRVFEARRITEADVGKNVEFRVAPRTNDPKLTLLTPLTQEQLGYPYEGRPFTMSGLADLRKKATEDADKAVVSWPITPAHIGMGIGGGEVPASEFQAVNPIFILLFGLVFTALWGVLGTRGIEPSTPVKFGFGLLQLGLGFGALWYGAHTADARGMVLIPWLLLGYLLHTTGELCVSPVGLSMVTVLSPARMVSTMMGAWFMASAFAQYLAGQIAKLTSPEQEGAAEQLIPPPVETVGVYGEVFGQIAIAALVAAVICWALAPLLNRWMHKGESSESAQSAA